MMFEVGSDEWMAERDALRSDCALGNIEAQDFLLAVGDYVELWDDLIDKDAEITEQRIHASLSNGILMAFNPFVRTNSEFIRAFIVQMINSYLDSEKLKKSNKKEIRNIAFHIRNHPLELYQAVAFCCGGWSHLREMSPRIREFFAFETFEEWEAENKSSKFKVIDNG